MRFLVFLWVLMARSSFWRSVCREVCRHAYVCNTDILISFSPKALPRSKNESGKYTPPPQCSGIMMSHPQHRPNVAEKIIGVRLGMFFFFGSVTHTLFFAYIILVFFLFILHSTPLDVWYCFYNDFLKICYIILVFFSFLFN